jgi:hypothetical protein
VRVTALISSYDSVAYSPLPLVSMNSLIPALAARSADFLIPAWSTSKVDVNGVGRE